MYYFFKVKRKRSLVSIFEHQLTNVTNWKQAYTFQCKQTSVKSVVSARKSRMTLRLRYLFKLSESIASLIQWLFQLGLVWELSGVPCQYCEKGRFDLSSVQIRVDSAARTKHAVRKCR